MSTFADCNGRQWRLRIVFGDLPDLMARGLDLNTVSNESFAQFRYAAAVGESTVADQAEFLWMLARRDAEKDGRTRKEFDDGLDWETFERAFDALAEAICDFQFRRLSARAKDPTTAEPSEAPASQSRSGAGEPAESAASTPGP